MGVSENSVPHCTQWFCWSLSLWKMAISLGIYPTFSDKPIYFLLLVFKNSMPAMAINGHRRGTWTPRGSLWDPTVPGSCPAWASRRRTNGSSEATPGDSHGQGLVLLTMGTQRGKPKFKGGNSGEKLWKPLGNFNKTNWYDDFHKIIRVTGQKHQHCWNLWMFISHKYRNIGLDP